MKTCHQLPLFSSDWCSMIAPSTTRHWRVLSAEGLATVLKTLLGLFFSSDFCIVGFSFIKLSWVIRAVDAIPHQITEIGCVVSLASIKIAYLAIF